MTWRGALVVAGVTATLTVTSGVGAMPAALANHQVGHLEPSGPAAWNFAADVPELSDSEWGFPIGGFGGVERGAPLDHVPVVFVHGNNVDHADWYVVRDDFREAGWTDQELWALSYNGLGNNAGSSPMRSQPEHDAEHQEMGGDNVSRITANDVNVPDLAAFIRMVQDYTGSERFSLVSHSLGVTIARKTMLVHPELAADMVAFVGIAGGNHGTSLCPEGSQGVVHGCDEIAAGTAWLEELNGPDGELETYGDTRWMTVYDGTGSGDVAYVGPDYAQSPRLKGATNVEFPGYDHNGLRIAPDVVETYRLFLEEAHVDTDAGAGGTDGAPDVRDDVPDGPSLPTTGGGFVALALAALGLGWRARGSFFGSFRGL